MPQTRYLVYSRILKLIAMLVGIACALWGILLGVFGIGYGDFAPCMSMRGFALLAVIMGVLYLIPNKRLAAGKLAQWYIAFTLLVSLALLVILISDMCIDWNQLHDRAAVFSKLFTCFLPTLAAPGSLIFYLIGHKKRLQSP
jgi:hypothetical protein